MFFVGLLQVLLHILYVKIRSIPGFFKTRERLSDVDKHYKNSELRSLNVSETMLRKSYLMLREGS